jgi:two-component system response regulator YesN
MRAHVKRRSVVGTWFISYAFVLVLPVIILASSMLRFVGVLDEEINYSNSIILEQIQLKMDSVVERYNTLCADISIDPNIRKLLGLRSRSDISPYELYQTVLSFCRLAATKEQAGDILIYFAGPDLVLDQSTYQAPDYYYDVYLKNSGIPKDTWLELISQRHVSSKYYRLQYEANGSPVDRIVLVRPIMLEMHSGLYANIVLFMDDTHFMQQDFTSFKRETILIIDSGDQVLYNSSGFPIEPGVLKYSDPAASTDIQLSGRNVIVSRIQSRSANWKYIIIVEKASYLEQVDEIKRQITMSVALCLVVGGALIAYSLLRNYRPLRGVLKALPRDNPPQEKYNEYQMISRAIGELQHEVQSVQHTMEQQKDALREQAVLSLLENRNISPLSTDEMLQKYDIAFQPGGFLVLLCMIRPGDGPFVEGNDSLSEAERDSLSCLILRNVISELFSETGMLVYPFRSGQTLGFLLNPPEGMDVLPVISAKLETAQVLFDAHFQIDYQCACGDLLQLQEDLPLAYNQALEVMEYKTTLDLDDVIFYRDIANIDGQKGLAYPLGFEAKLVNAIKIGDAPRAFEAVKSTVDLNLERRCSPDLMRYLMVNIAGTVIKAVSELDEKTVEKIPELSFQTVMRGGSIYGMRDEIQRVIKTVCSIISARMQDEATQPGKALYAKCLSYVDKLYADEATTVSKMADEFGVHIVHLSRIFKEFSGESLSSHINLVRIEKAKELILSGMKLEQTADAVGFGSLRTFMRTFKKFEGITPGQYKESASG